MLIKNLIEWRMGWWVVIMIIIFAIETATNLSIFAYLFVKPKLFSYIYIFEYWSIYFLNIVY